MPELEKHLKQYEPPAVVTDNEDGSHTVEYTCDYAGFYRIDVTMDSTPVGASPYNACICNATIAFPPTVIFYPLQALPEDSHLHAHLYSYRYSHDRLPTIRCLHYAAGAPRHLSTPSRPRHRHATSI